MNTLGPKAYVWQRAWIWDKLQINGKLWLSLRGQLSQEWSSERRLNTVIICLGRRVLEPVTSWKLEGGEYVLTSGSMDGLFFSGFWVNNLTTNDEHRFIESPQSTALGLRSLATITTLQNHLSLSSAPARHLLPVLDLEGCSFLRDISSC